MTTSLLPLSRVVALSTFAAVCLVCAPGCFSDKTSTSKKPTTQKRTVRRTPVKRASNTAKHNIPKDWIKSTWIEHLATHTDELKPFLGDNADEHLRADVVAVLKNQWAEAMKKDLNIAKLPPIHQIWRARMHLRMARFYQLSHLFALHLNEDLARRRLKRSKKLQLGRLFRYYFARLLCATKREKEGVALLKLASKEVPPNRKMRLQAWLLVCQTPAAQRASLGPQLANLTFAKDPDGWAEFSLIHTLFGIHTKTPPVSTVRGRLFEAVRRNQPLSWKRTRLPKQVDEESITEKETTTTLRYFDPWMDRMMAMRHAQQALRHLSRVKKKDAYLPFWRAQAHYLLGQSKEANKAFSAFLKQPPKKPVLAHLLFSDYMNPAELVAAARLALLVGQQSPDKHNALQARYKHNPSRALVAAGLLSLAPKSKRFASVRAGVQQIQQRFLYWDKHYRSDKKDAGSQLARQFRLHRFTWRHLLLEGSDAAIRSKNAEYAVRWLELLHHKDVAYKIGEENDARQIVLTAWAYYHMGRLDVAMIFFRKNRVSYPLLTQHWTLLGLVRIIKGMGSHSMVKSGG